MDDWYRRLGASIVLLAISDWHNLQDGDTPTYYCNFDELEYFFEHECDKYLFGDLTSEKIMKQLKAKKR